MACPTCSATMQNLGVEGQRIFWCPRCGTCKAEMSDDFAITSAPSLATHVRNAAEDAEKVSLDSRTLVYAVPIYHWVACCEAVGVKLGKEQTG